jgi:hypothetical protein
MKKDLIPYIIIGMSIVIGFVLHGFIADKDRVIKGKIYGDIRYANGKTQPQEPGSKVEIHDNYIVVTTTGKTSRGPIEVKMVHGLGSILNFEMH